MLKRCLVANRGEIALRVIRACQELGVESVAVYSDADANAAHVHMADAAFHIGGAAPTDSYLQHERIVQTALDAGCDCVHPGYGFLSENAAFAQAVLEAGLTWVGPPPDAIRLMGFKTEARALMQKANVPLVPGFDSAEADDDSFTAAADRIGYPVMVKAAGGGGGKGIRIVRSPDELLAALQTARREAQKAFGDPRVFLEKYIETARHIEVQVIADIHGNTLHLFERECSTQRRHQKIIEESPSPLLNDAQREAITSAGVAAAQAVRYVNAGTVEFIATPEGNFYFLEMNTRLQVEHPVTEMVTGLDLVQLQLKVAAGEPLPFAQSDVHQQGHAIECRIYAEDAANQFLPAVGPVLHFESPQGPGIRVDSGIRSGDAVTIHYDPMIAKVITHGLNREAAIARMRHALSQTVVLGVTTNIPFLRRLLDHPVFVGGEMDTAYVDTHLESLLPAPAEPTPEMLIALALADMNQAVAFKVGEAAGGASDADRFSPWDRTDGFRIGQG